MEEKCAALNALVAYARANSPFYARHLPEGGTHCKLSRLGQEDN